MRPAPLVLSLLLGSMTPAFAQIHIDFGLPGVNIGINVPVYPRLQRIPGYPVYYAPGLDRNYFFYDGLYWVYEGDNWYASSWYNGPWGLVDPYDVPLYVLRVPVRYYRHAPAYFHGWRSNEPPRWGEHWGGSWEKRRSGWDRWNRGAVPAPAPLPSYQRQYSGSKYPHPSQQFQLENRNYRYRPRDPVARERFQHERVQAPAPRPQRVTPSHPVPQRTTPQRVTPAHPVPQRTTPQRTTPQRAAPQQQHQGTRPQGKEQGKERGKDSKDSKEKGHER